MRHWIALAALIVLFPLPWWAWFRFYIWIEERTPESTP